jgi:hypothetical protein
MAAILVAFLWVAISAGAFGLHGPAVHCTAAQESTRMICAR